MTGLDVATDRTRPEAAIAAVVELVRGMWNFDTPAARCASNGTSDYLHVAAPAALHRRGRFSRQSHRDPVSDS